jgi:hypothetical protein
MKRLVSSLGVLALVAMLPAAAQAQMGDMPEGEDVTVRGTVIDLDCKFRMGQSGEGHKMCAEVCADAGLPLAILGDDGKLYMPVGGGMPGKPVSEHNKGLKEFAEQQVVVRGKAFQAGGAFALAIESVRGS